MVEQDSLTLSEDEAALYDRQIRLWGLDAQKRLRAARVLLVGIGGLGAEVAKNIVLSGIKSLTILDHQQVTEAARCSQFLIDHAADLEKNRALSSLQRTQQLNPMVAVSADPSNVADKPDDFFREFDVVCATCCSEQQLLRLNDLCRDNGSLFFAGDVFGYYGYSFADLNEHEFSEEVLQKMKPVTGSGDADGEPAVKKTKLQATETVTVKRTTSFTRLKDALCIDWKGEGMTVKAKKTPNTYFIMRVLMEFCKVHQRAPEVASLQSDRKTLSELRHTLLSSLAVDESLVPLDFVNFCFAELSPVCAVVGGVLGQEIIKAVSQRDVPHNNFFFFNGQDGSGIVDQIC